MLGDDPAYSDYVSQILKGTYPDIGTHSVFACRPIVLYAIALPVYLFGWFDWSFVLPILMASLACVMIVYLVGNHLSGMWAGVIAAVVFITFPLDAVHATTVSNDILLSAFIWGGGFILLVSYHRYHQKKFLLLTTVSGFIVGAAIAIKFNAVVAPAIFLMTLLAVLWGRLRRGGYKTLLFWSMGWITANIILCLFLYWRSGDFIAHYHTEMRFNLDYNPSNFFDGGGSLMRFLLYYPQMILGMKKEGHVGYEFMPYGYFFLCFFFCIPLIFLKRFEKLRLPACMALLYMGIMEFAPLQVTPHYVPIHRLPRFLHIASIPAAVTMGIALAACLRGNGNFIKVCIWTGILSLGLTSLYWSYVKATFYKDCSYDQRWAWELVRNTDAKNIVTDIEMRNYFMFRSGFQPPARILYPERLPNKVPPQSLVIVGGARRPDMHPTYANDWYKKSERNDWLLISEASYPLKPWRLSALRIYRTDSDGLMRRGEDIQSPSYRKHYQQHPEIHGMRKIAELDVGDANSEKMLNYQISRLSWQGIRDFSYPDGVTVKDDGIAYRGVERITVKKLIPHRPVIIVKRLDPTVARQKVKVYFQNHVVGTWAPCREGIPGHWHESIFEIPSEVVTDTDGELSFSFDESDADINSFYYWFYQP